MLLVQDTIRKFGYDPTLIIARGADSLKPIVRQCASCGKLQDSSIRHRDSLCNACKPKRQRIHERSSRPPTFEPSIILVEETIARFGYDPAVLRHESSKLVVRRCSGCGEVQERQRRVADTVCISCATHLRWVERTEKFKAQGLSPMGKAPEQLAAAKKTNNTNSWHIRRNKPCYKVSSLLFSTMNNFLHGECSVSRNLSFTADQLRQHLQGQIDLFGGKCPMCSRDFNECGYDVDHKIPLRTAQTEDDVRLLFRLENLSVLCPDCNRRIKSGRLVDYWTDKITPKNKEAVVAFLVQG